jgi:hypothetical protein
MNIVKSSKLTLSFRRLWDKNRVVRMRERYLFGAKKRLGAKIKGGKEATCHSVSGGSLLRQRDERGYFFPFIPLNISSILGMPPIISIMFCTLR